MSEREGGRGDDGLAGDYSYDEAHDQRTAAAPPPEGRHHEVQAQGAGAAAPASDPDRDYGYDLAHDVPPARPDRRS